MELEGNSNAGTAEPFLRQLREKHPGPLQVIWDNAPAHRGGAVREYLRMPCLDLRLVNPRLHEGRLCRGTARTSTVAIDRVVHHSVILEFDFPSYRTDAAQQRGQVQEVDLQYYLTRDRRRKALRGPYHLGSRQHQRGLLHRLARLPAKRPGPLGASPPFPRMPPLDRIATGHCQGVGTAFGDPDRVEWFCQERVADYDDASGSGPQAALAQPSHVSGAVKGRGSFSGHGDALYCLGRRQRRPRDVQVAGNVISASMLPAPVCRRSEDCQRRRPGDGIAGRHSFRAAIQLRAGCSGSNGIDRALPQARQCHGMTLGVDFEAFHGG